MDLSKRQKMMLGGLGLAVGAFAIDAILPGPSAASAATPTDAGTPVGITRNASSAEGIPATASVGTNANHEALMRVVERLRSVEPGEDADTNGVPDPFAPTRGPAIGSLEEIPLEIDMTAIVSADDQPTPLSAPVPPTIRISSIMNAPEGRMALLNGQLHREGDRISGWTITRIAERSIRLSNGTHEIRVPMDR